MGVTHTFVSAIADDPAAAAAGQILPSHWNAAHTINVDLAAEVSGVLPVANGGTGTATPDLVAGTNVTITGSWPNQTITASGGTPGGSSGQLQYNNAGSFDGSYLWQSTNILEQRNSTNAQAFRLYNTFTDSSNYERADLKWTSNVLQLTTERAGTGVARSIEVRAATYTGSGAQSGGAVTFYSGAGSAAASNSGGGNIEFRTGNGAGTLAGNGGSVNFYAGNGSAISSTASLGGAFYMTAGNGGAQSGTGGAFTASAGMGGPPSGWGGELRFIAGPAYNYFDENNQEQVYSGKGGTVNFYGGENWTNTAEFGAIQFHTATSPALVVAAAGDVDVRKSILWGYAGIDPTAANYSRAFARFEGTVFRIGTEATGTGTVRNIEFRTGGSTRLTVGSTGGLTIADANNVAVGTTTGTKIGTTTAQKIGFWNATPIVQPTTAVSGATVGATGAGDVVAASTTFDGYTIPQIVKALRNAGLLA